MKCLQKEPAKSTKIIRILEQPLQDAEMGLPIYQMEVYQKAPPKLKHTNSTHKSPDWSLQLKKIRNL